MNLFTRIVIAALFTLTFHASPALSATIHVPGDQPTIQAGIDAAIDGDLVLVALGTYIENINFLGKAITVQSEMGAHVTIIDSNQSGSSVVTFDSGETEVTVLNGFKITNGNAYFGGGIFCNNCSSPTITNCTITENSAAQGGGVACGYGFSAPTILSCTISNNAATYGGGLSFWESGPMITNCTITDNTSPEGGGIYSDYSSSPTITNCTLSENTAEYGRGIFCDDDSFTTIANCILWSDSAPPNPEIFIESGQLVATYSNIQGGWIGEGNIDADPIFVGGGDYHLTADSPCIDAGTDAGIYTDIDGDVRPQGSDFDMGSDEYDEYMECWATQIVDFDGSVGQHSSIAIDSSDNVHISYYDAGDDDLKYAASHTGTWVTQVVDGNGSVGQYSSIAIDSSDNAHISYYDAGDDDLKYATNVTRTWVTQVVDGDGSVGKYSSIAIDSSDKIHISYYDAALDDLKYISNSTGIWETPQTVDSEGSVGQYSNIAIDSSDNAHISYYDAGADDLKYAANVTGTWVTQVVDGDGSVGKYSSIAIDSSDKIHISYYDAALDDLKYISNSTGIWETPQTVDSEGSVGQYSSITVDSSRKAHISYFRTDGDFLKYATNKSEVWETFYPDPEGGSGQHTSIALDSFNNVHISCFKGSGHYLRYVTGNDSDGDGYSYEDCGGYDCDDSDFEIHTGAVEVCYDTIDNDCDDLIDLLDPDCFPEFILEMDASFSSGKLYLDFTLGTEQEAIWVNYAIIGWPGDLQLVELWTIQLPVIVPPVEIGPISFWFPSVGYVGIYTAIYSRGERELYVLEWVDTGK